MIAASFNDSCRSCHASIPDSGGCISEILCEDSCRLLHPYHAYLFKKRSTTTSMPKLIDPYYFGSAIVDGVERMVRRMTKTSALEVVPDEDLTAIRRDGLVRLHKAGKISAQEALSALDDTTTVEVRTIRAAGLTTFGFNKQIVPDDFGSGLARDASDNFPDADPADVRRYKDAIKAGDGAAASEAMQQMIKSRSKKGGRS